MMRRILLVLVSWGMVAVAAQAPAAEESAATKPVRVILDADIDSDCDDVGALAMLHALADNGECEILGVMMSDANGESPRCTDAINTYYGRPSIPIGVRKPGGGPAPSRYAKQIAAEFPHDLKYDEAPDAVALYRQILKSSEDQSVVIITIGTLENLAELAESDAELVRRKVKLVSCMGGQYPRSGPKAEHNFGFGQKAATARMVRAWSTPIMFSGWELGVRVGTGARLTQLPATNPVRRAYELYGKLGKDHFSWDQTSVLYGVRGLRDYWAAKTTGTNHIEEDGRNDWRPTPDGEHAYLIEKMPPGEVARVIEDLMMQSPKSR